MKWPNPDWIPISNIPFKLCNYWCYPTHDIRKVSVLYWDGKEFSSGKYRPSGITHYKEVVLQEPGWPI